MLEQFCDDFLAVVPLQLPELLDKRKMEKPVKYDDYVLLTFQLNTPFTIEEVMDMLEDEMEMITTFQAVIRSSDTAAVPIPTLLSDGCSRSTAPQMSVAWSAR